MEKEIQSFFAKNGEATHISLSAKFFGNKYCDLVANCLGKCQQIHHLDLASNNIGSDGLTYLCPALRNLSNLQSVSLEWNPVKEGLALLCDALSCLPNLQQANLQNCQIPTSGAWHIVELLQKSNSLNDLDLRHNRLGNEGVVNIVRHLKDNYRITKLQLLGNEADLTNLQAADKLISRNKNLQHSCVIPSGLSEGSGLGVKYSSEKEESPPTDDISEFRKGRLVSTENDMSRKFQAERTEGEMLRKDQEIMLLKGSLSEVEAKLKGLQKLAYNQNEELKQQKWKNTTYFEGTGSVEEVHKKIEEMKEINLSLQGKIQQLEVEKEKEALRASEKEQELQESLDVAQKRIDASSEEVGEAVRLIQRLRTDLNRRCRDVEKAEEAVEEEQRNCKRVEAKLQEEIAQYQAELKQSKNHINRLKEAYGEASVQFERRLKEWSTIEENLQEERANKEALINNLQNKIVAMKQESLEWCEGEVAKVLNQMRQKEDLMNNERSKFKEREEALKMQIEQTKQLIHRQLDHIGS